MSAANGLRAAIGVEPTPDWTLEGGGGLRAARAKVGRQAADAAWKQGAALSMRQFDLQREPLRSLTRRQIDTDRS